MEYSTMADSVLQHILFWSIGYGSLMGMGYAPVLMMYTNSWTVRTIILGFSVPMGALLTTALSISVYGYGVFMNTISGILIQPLFVHSMIHTLCLSGILYSGYALFLKECECESEKTEDTDEASDSQKSDSEESEEVEEGSDNSEETDEGSECSETSEEGSEQDNEWRTTANFEGLRTAPPLPE